MIMYSKEVTPFLLERVDSKAIIVTVQTIVKIDEILKNRFVDKLRQDAKSG